MPARKLLLIGIDGIEPSMVNDVVAKGNSKGFGIFTDGKDKVELYSTFPPDTSIAWPSIYTGINPHKLRLSYDFDILDEMPAQTKAVREKLRGRTFWDYVSKRDLFSCIINPSPVFPSWMIKGTMISAQKNAVSATPELIADKYKIPTMTYSEDYPAAPGERAKKYNRVVYDTLQLSKFSQKLLSDFDYNLFFVCFQTLDSAQHFLWRFEDINDPTKPLIGLYRGYLAKFYELFDNIVKAFIDKFGNDYTIVVFGDHGHGARPWKLFSLNELLRRFGFAKPAWRGTAYKIRSYLKALALEFAYYSWMDWLAYKTYSYLKKKNTRMRLANVSRSTSVATKGSFGKQYSGIYINKSSIEKRKHLTDVVANFVTNLNIVESVVKTRDIYGNEHDFPCPDILIKLNDEYGFQHGFYVPLIQRNFEKRIISGGHMPRTLLMLWPGPCRACIRARRNFRVVDIAPSVLEHFGIEIPSNFDGKPIWQSL